MRIRGIGTAKRVAGWARSLLYKGPLILGYHQVADAEWDPQKLCVSPKNFAAQLEILRHKAQPLSLAQLAHGLREGRKATQSFAITLDDGYSDTLHDALPILRQAEVPATAYVTTGLIGRRFWWCEIQQLVESAGSLPEQIQFQVDNHGFEWRKVTDAPADRARLLQSLGDLFRGLRFEAHEEAISRLTTSFGETANNESNTIAMSEDEVATLARSELVEVGSHMVTHTSLSLLSAEQQREELATSKARLEDICGRSVTSCSYPNGRISRDTANLAREVGYLSGCTSQEELVAGNCDPMLLPRVWVGDWDGEQFSRWLRWWLR